MNLAILHYHLFRSGVTRVIENQLLALDAVLDPKNYVGRASEIVDEVVAIVRG